MLRALAHRGRDQTGVFETTFGVIGATRLAIRGLQSGRQPITDPETGVIVACNGEIDNHRELRDWLSGLGRSVPQQTDIAVIPGMYLEQGDAFVERLKGAFAVAVWDPRVRKLLLARDRVGERPLFYSVQGELVRFATEVSALTGTSSDAATLSREALNDFLQFGCMTAPKSPFVEIQKVRPGEIVSISSVGIVKKQYWKWEICTAAKRDASQSDFDKIFSNAVRDQTEVEVPFGVFLSGGLDSSLAAAVLRRIHPKRQITAFSLRFEEESYDEGGFASEVAAHLGLDSVSVWVQAHQFPSMICDLLRRSGEPLADPAWVPTALLAKRASEDVKLVLGGEGGDEVFGGYPTYLAAGVGNIYSRLPGVLRTLLRRGIEWLPTSDNKVAISYLLKRFVESGELGPIERHLAWKANIPASRISDLGFEMAARPVPALPSTGNLLDVLQLIDLETTLAEGLLTKADRASMASSIEIRTPYLAPEVLEFAATLRVSDRVSWFQTKRFLKNYARRYLPERIVYRRKRGLSVPLPQWFRGPLSGWAQKSLENEKLTEIGIPTRERASLFEEHMGRRGDRSRSIWTLVVLSEWLNIEAERNQNLTLINGASSLATFRIGPGTTGFACSRDAGKPAAVAAATER